MQVELGELLFSWQSEGTSQISNNGRTVFQQDLKLRNPLGAIEFETSISLSNFCLIRSDSELLCVHLVEFPLLLYLLGQSGVLVSEVIDLLVQLVDVFINEVVLLFVLQKGRGDFLQIACPTLFFDFFETFPNGSHSLLVIFNDAHSFLILVDELSQSKLDQGLRISGLVLLLGFTLTLEEVATTAQLEIAPSCTHLLPEFLGLAFILSF